MQKRVFVEGLLVHCFSLPFCRRAQIRIFVFRQPRSIMKNRCFLLITLISLVSASCATREIHRRFDAIEQAAQSHPDSTLALLHAIPQEKLTTRGLQARYALLNAKLLYKNFIDTADLAVIAPAVAYYAKHGSVKDKMETAYYQGCILQNGGSYSEASNSLTDALSLAEKMGDSFTAGLINASLSVLYNSLHNYSEQRLYAERAVKSFEEENNKDYSQYARVLLGVAQHNLRNYADAEAIYKEILNHGNPDEINRQEAMVHLALTQAARPDIKVDEADSLFTRVLAETGTLPTQNMWGAYAYVLDKKGRQDEADGIYAKLDTADIINYGWYALSLYERKHYQQAFDHLSASITHQSEILNVALSQAAMKTHREQAVQRQIKAEEDAKMQRMIFTLIIALFLVVSAFLFLLIWHRYNRVRDEKIRLEQMAEQVHRQLNEMEKSVSATRKDSLQESYIRLYQSRFKEMGILYERLCYAERHGSESQVILSEVKRMLKGIQMDTGGSRRFEDMIDERLNGIMARFRKDFPRRPEKDYRLMSFVIAGFDANTIALLLDMPSTASVHMRKSRLKSLILASDNEKKNKYLKFF